MGGWGCGRSVSAMGDQCSHYSVEVLSRGFFRLDSSSFFWDLGFVDLYASNDSGVC